MIGRPPRTARVIWVLARTGLRRWANRLGMQFRGRKKKDPVPVLRRTAALATAKSPRAVPRRIATPRKKRGGRILLALFAALMFLQGLFLSMRFLARLQADVDALSVPAGVIALTPDGYKEIAEAARAIAAIDAGQPDTRQYRPRSTAERRAECLEKLERSLRWSHMLPGGFDMARPDREARARELVKIFEEKGAGAFRMSAGNGFTIDIDRWSRSAGDGLLLSAFALFFPLLFSCVLFSSLGAANKDLGAVSWHVEWLFTLPARAQGLFLAQILESALTSGLGWALILPLLLVAMWASGWGWGTLPVGLAASLGWLAMVAALRIVIETALRKRCSHHRLKSFQALFTILGLVFLGVMSAVALLPATPPVFLRAAQAIPHALLWNPLTLPALLVKAEPVRWFALAAVAASGAAFALGGARICQRLVGDGLIGSRSSSKRRRGIAEPGGRRSWLPGGVVGKEIRLVLRDRNLLVQTLVFPIGILGLQLTLNPHLLAGVFSEFRHGAALAFGVGAYVLVFSAFQILSLEGGALWILFTLPRRVEQVLLRKTILWSALATLYTALILLAVAWNSPAPGIAALVESLFAIAGTALYAFIAAGLGALSTDPLETEASRRVNPVVIYVYLFLMALYMNTLYQPSLWTSLVQLVLSGALAFSLWQKVRDRIPYLLDPTAAPPPRIALSDGLIAVLAFFVFQGILLFAFLAGGTPPGAAMFYSYTIAAAAVALFALYVFARIKVKDLAREVGLVLEPGMGAWSLLWGAMAGGAAALCGFAYLRLVDRFEFLRRLKEETLRLDLSSIDGSALSLGIIAVLAAPPFEEFIFRGLVYRGMRRSARPLPSVLLSAGLFAIVHPPISAAPVFVLGVLTAVSFERTRCLLAPVLAHMIYNAALLALG